MHIILIIILKIDIKCMEKKQETSELVYEIPNKLNVFNPWKNCSSAQLLIEVK